MEPLKIYLESLLDDEDEIATNDDALIKTFIEENYDLHWNLGEGMTIRQDKKLGTVVDFDGFIVLKNNKIKSLTNGLFKFGKCIDFDCASCEGIKDLEGAPGECIEFACTECNELKNLVGAPQKCSLFDCGHCESLESLEGAPRECKKFYCHTCRKLTSFDDMPDDITELFNIRDCRELRNLPLPHKITGKIYK